MKTGDVEIPDDAVDAMCRKWKIRRLEIFGSARTGQPGPDSDIDLLAGFDPDEQWSLLDMALAEEDLSSLFGRRVDLVDRKNLEKSAIRFRRDAILNSAEVVHVARSVRGDVRYGSGRGNRTQAVLGDDRGGVP